MGSTNWFRFSLAPAALLVAWAAVPALAQRYEHPAFHWKIDFPAGWLVAERTPRGAVASAPKGLARLVVSKARTAAKDAKGEIRLSAATSRRRYGAARVLIEADISVRGHPGRRVEFSFAEPGSGRAMKGWRTVLVENGVADEVAFEAAEEDYAAHRAAAEAALRSFLPSFDRTGALERR